MPNDVALFVLIKAQFLKSILHLILLSISNQIDQELLQSDLCRGTRTAMTYSPRDSHKAGDRGAAAGSGSAYDNDTRCNSILFPTSRILSCLLQSVSVIISHSPVYEILLIFKSWSVSYFTCSFLIG